MVLRSGDGDVLGLLVDSSSRRWAPRTPGPWTQRRPRRLKPEDFRTEQPGTRKDRGRTMPTCSASARLSAGGVGMRFEVDVLL